MARRPSERTATELGVPAVVPPENDAEATRTAYVIRIFPEVCTRWAGGKSMEQIAGELGIGTGLQLRKVIYNNRALRVVLDEYTPFRADELFEKAVVWAHEAAELGGPSAASGLKTAIDTVLKVAALMKPSAYGDTKKTVKRDAAGRVIETETTTAAAITPGEAYERMIKGEEA